MSLVERGEITEIVGPLSSGRTSLVTTCLAEVTARGACVALVDADGAFDPESARRGGVDLARLLWVRAGGRRDRAVRALDLVLRCPGFALVVLDAGELPPRVGLPTPFGWKLAARRAGTALLLVGARRVAGAAASLVVRVARERLAWTGPGAVPTRLGGLASAVRVVRRGGARAGRAPRGGDEPRLAWWCA
jgi:hypothetical protein